MRIGAVPGNDGFHEVPVKIFQRVARCVAQTSGTFLKSGPDKSQPNVAGHAESRPQSRGGAAWMFFQKVFHILFYDIWQLLDFN